MDVRVPVFRVFVSSTFDDFREERDALQSGAFARLEAMCAERGARFQAIDLRWGVDELSSIDQQALPICLRELARCLEPTPLPNFVVLVGERYGWRPLPNRIDQATFQVLQGAAKPADKRRLDRWYRFDRNEQPGCFVLLPREGRTAVPRVWAREEAALRNAVLRAATQLGWAPDDPRLEGFTRSATHHEIVEGALSPDVPSEGVFVYLRRSEGEPRRRFVRRYVDQPERVRTLVDQLRDEVPSDQVYEYALNWPTRFWQWGRPTRDLDALNDRVEADLSRAIQRELDAIEDLGAAEREEIEHRDFQSRRGRGVVGRDGPLARIAQYLEPTSDRVGPLFVTGPSGCGKSALVARAATEHAGEGVNLARFVSITPASSTLQGLLADLCHQLVRQAELPASELPDGAGPLRAAFAERLEQAAERGPVVVFIDAIDQLDPADEPESLSWLPERLPVGCRIVISVLDRPGELAGRAADNARAQYPPEAFIDVPRLEVADGEAILDARLAELGRTLQPSQRERVLNGFARSGLPLYLQLAIEQASRWRSWDRIPVLPGDVRGLLDQFFDSLVEARGHDAGLVSRVLGYLAASANGLGEHEILDLLGADDDWFGAFRRSARHRLPRRRPEEGRWVPVIVWVRLLGDLEPYLSERFADGTPLYGFYHRQVAEAAAERFLRRDRHMALATYFGGQPTWYRSRTESSRLNQRKVSELPVQLRGAGKLQELVELLTAPEFIDGAVQAGQHYGLLLAMQQAYGDVEDDAVLGPRLARAVVEASLDPGRAQGIDATYVHDILVYQGDRTFYRAVLADADRRDSDGNDALRPFRLGLANLVRRDGDLDQAKARFEKIRDELEQAGVADDEHATLRSRALYEIGYVHYLRGEFEPAVTLLEESADAAPMGPDGEVAGWISRCVAAVVSLHGGYVDPDAVLAVARIAEEYFLRHAEQGHPVAERWVMNTRMHVLEVHLDRGQVAEAREAFGAVAKSPWFRKFGREELLARVHGLLRSLEGDHDEARHLYRSFLDTFRGRDLSQVQAYARYLLEWSTVLARAGDEAASRAALELAASHPGEPGNHLWRDQARARLDA